jgi:deoxyhypusine synthase
MKKDAENVSVYADATITLPLVVAGALDAID